MSTPLRAFLLVRSVSGDWAVSVFHDLEAALKGWSSRPHDSLGAVFHVGFERSPARLFDDVVQSFPDQILLTAGARFALPSTYSSSSHPVGVVDGRDVFLATGGWGYDADDPLPIAPPSDLLRDWVGEFAAAYPDEEAALRASGVVSEASFIAHEGKLRNKLRHDVSLFRFRALVPEGTDDPCEFARAAPPWLRAIELQTLDLTVRLSNVFVNMAIQTVGELGDLALSDMLRVPNLGRKSIRDLMLLLNSVLQIGPPQARENQTLLEGSLIASVRRSLLTCSAKEQDIVKRRMGLDCKPETLAEIGVSYGVTRERVRQIESKTVSRLVQREVWDDILSQKLTNILSSREFPLPLLGIEAVDSWFVGVGDKADAIRYMLSTMCRTGVSLLEVDGVEYFSFIDSDRWILTLREARQLLAAGAEKNWSKEHCRVVVSSLLPDEATEFRTLLWDKSSILCNFVEDDTGVLRLRSYGRGAEQLVEAILEEAEHPLHYSEIADAAAKRGGRPIEVRRAHHAAAAVAFLFGRGVFGLRKHLPISDAEMELLADRAAEIISEMQADRQWHASEVLSSLIERGDVHPAVDKFVLDIALRSREDLTSLGRLVWSQSSQSDDAARIDVRQAVISTIQAAGRPMRAGEIRQRLTALRGIGQHFQIVQVDPLIRVGHGLWGLNDRDVVLKRSDQGAFLDLLAMVLERREIGLHLSEAISTGVVPPALPPEAAFSIAMTDPRFRVTVGQYLYLEKWGDSRRISVSEAVGELLQAARHGLPFDDLVQEVKSKVGRDVERTAISQSLQASGGRVDELGRWIWPNIEAEVELDVEAAE